MKQCHLLRGLLARVERRVARPRSSNLILWKSAFYVSFSLSHFSWDVRNKEITTKKQRDHLPWHNWESCKEITCASLAVSAFRLLSFVRLLLGSLGAILKLIFSQALIWFCFPPHDKTKQKQSCLLHERQQHIMAMPRTRARIRARAVRTRGRGDSGSSLTWIFLSAQSFLLLFCSQTSGAGVVVVVVVPIKVA